MPRLRCGLITLEGAGGGLIVPVAAGFAANDIDVEVLTRDDDWAVQAYDFLVTYGPMQPMQWAIDRLNRLPNVPPLVVWFTEQVPNPKPSRSIHLAAQARFQYDHFYASRRVVQAVVGERSFVNLSQRAGRLRALGELLALKAAGLLTLVCAFTDANAGFLRAYKLPAVAVPMGVHPALSRYAGDGVRDIDVVFLGSTVDRRRAKLVPALERQLQARGINLVVKDGSPQRGVVFGETRDHLLSRSKLMLNLMRQPWDDPIFRLLLAAPTGAMTLSETVQAQNRGPFQPGVHFAMADVAQLADRVEYYLAHEAERRAIAERACAFVSGELTMAKMAGQVLAALRQQVGARLGQN